MPKEWPDRLIMFSVIGLVAWAIVVLPAIKLSEQSEPHHRGQPSETKYQDSRSSQAGIKSLTYDNYSAAQQKGDWYDTLTDKTPDWFVAIFTGLLVFVTYRLVTSTNKLWNSGERQLKFLESGQRPWIQVAFSFTDNFCAAGGGAKTAIKINVLNVGNAPAFRVVTQAKLFVSDKRNSVDTNKANLIEHLKRRSQSSFYNVVFPQCGLDNDDAEIVAIGAHDIRSNAYTTNKGERYISVYPVIGCYYESAEGDEHLTVLTGLPTRVAVTSENKIATIRLQKYIMHSSAT